MNFYFYGPYQMGFSTADSYSDFVDERIDTLIPDLNMTNDSILMTYDVRDYFPSVESHSVRSSGTPRNRIFLRGSENLPAWDSELLLNVALHEIMHTFMGYPGKVPYFYSDHPASFTGMSEFETFEVAQSPTGNEGYYDVYSVMNQVRIYMAESDIAPLAISSLDKKLLGIESPYEPGNYTFYEGSIQRISDRFVASGLTEVEYINDYNCYSDSTDADYWSVLDTESTSMGTSTSFTIPATEDALWVFAEDDAHEGHFAVVGTGVSSVSILDGQNVSILLGVGTNNTQLTSSDTQITFTFDYSSPGDSPTVTYNPDIFSCTGSWSGNTYSEDCDIIGAGDGSITVTVDGYEVLLGTTIDTQGPVVTNLNPGSASNDDPISFECDAQDSNLETTVIYASWTGWHEDSTGDHSLDEGTYTWSCYACDTYGQCTFAANQSLVVDRTSPQVSLSSPADNESITGESVDLTFIFSDSSPQSNCVLTLDNSSYDLDIETSHNFELASGHYMWHVNCFDIAGNSGISEEWEFDFVYEEPEDPPNTGGGGGGSGGGSSGGSSSSGGGPSFSGAEQDEVTVRFLDVEEGKELEWNPASTIISSFTTVATTDSGSGTVKITTINASEITELPEHDEAVTFKIEEKDLNLTSFKIVVKVDETWTDKTFLFFDSSWETIDAVFVENLDGEDHYSIEADKFGIYSIINIKEEIEDVGSEPGKTETREEVFSEPLNETIGFPEEDIEEEIDGIKFSKMFFIYGAGILILLGIFAFFIIRKVKETY